MIHTIEKRLGYERIANGANVVRYWYGWRSQNVTSE